VTTWYFIRHGETDWNREGRWQGQADVPLNTKGHEQAFDITDKLAHIGIEGIFSSDLLRARQTAEIISARLKINQVQFDERLREIHQGEWQGLLIEDIRTKYRVGFNQRQKDPWSVAPPGGETARQVQYRVESLLSEVRTKENGKNIAFVTHGFVIAVIQTIFKGLPEKNVWELVPENGEICQFTLQKK
jgi:broad specificity phosphatase PhoE